MPNRSFLRPRPPQSATAHEVNGRQPTQTSTPRFARAAIAGLLAVVSCVAPKQPVAQASPTSLASPTSRGGPGQSKATGSADASVTSKHPTPSDDSHPNSPTTDPSRPVHTPDILRLRAAAQRRILSSRLIEDEQGRVAAFEPAPSQRSSEPDRVWLPPNGNSLGSFVPVEHESALRYFHDHLKQLVDEQSRLQAVPAPLPRANHQPSPTPGAARKLRILAYGASHTQGDFFTGYLRYYLQSRFGNGGQGFMQLARVNPWYRSLDYEVKSNRFKVHYAQSKQPELDGYFGLLGAAGVASSKYAVASIFPRNQKDLKITASQFELYFFGQPNGGDFTLRIDSTPASPSNDQAASRGTKHVERLSARGDNQPRYHRLDLQTGWHTLKVQPEGNGSVRLFGVSMERKESGVVIDTLGINGTRHANQLMWNEALWGEQLIRRKPALVLFAYGTNEAVDTKQPIETYRQNLTEALRRFRAALPEASCVLVGPGDFPKEVAGGYAPRPRLVQLIEVQRNLAPSFNCGFWDTYAFMGGQGAMQRWAAAVPRMGQKDHIHLSARGYVKMGMAFGDALMRRYDQDRMGEAAGQER